MIQALAQRLRFRLLTGVTAIPARAEDFPTHPVRIITDGAPGSAIDVPVRIIAEGLSRIWGQQAVVVNQPGAGGAIAARTAATAAPDGYTLGVIAVSAFVAAPGTADNLPIQVPKRFHAGRLSRRRADVHRRGSLARRENPAGADRHGESRNPANCPSASTALAG